MQCNVIHVLNGDALTYVRQRLSVSIASDLEKVLPEKIGVRVVSDMGEFEETKRQIRKFTEERNWDKFHNPKDLAIALSIEANELLEVFLWKDTSDVKREKVEEELADVFNYAFLLADKYDFDVASIIRKKIEANARKYPVDKARGSAKKYTELK